eukprot:scaffold65187_cov67-Phaeocystis_antarctica.AAC.2
MAATCGACECGHTCVRAHSSPHPRLRTSHTHLPRERICTLHHEQWHEQHRDKNEGDIHPVGWRCQIHLQPPLDYKQLLKSGYWSPIPPPIGHSTNASDGLTQLLPRIDKVEELRHGKEQGTCPPCHCGSAQEQPCHPTKVADGESDVEADPELPLPLAEGQPLEVDGGAHWPTDDDVEVFSCDHGGEYGLIVAGRGSEQARDANNAAGHNHCIPGVLTHCVHAVLAAPKRARRLNIAGVAAHKPPPIVERRERGAGVVWDVLVQVAGRRRLGQDARQERCTGSERAVGVALRFPKQGLTASTGEGVVEDKFKEQAHAIDLLQ